MTRVLDTRSACELPDAAIQEFDLHRLYLRRHCPVTQNPAKASGSTGRSDRQSVFDIAVVTTYFPLPWIPWMEAQFPQSMLERFQRSGVIAVIVIDKA
jgi:hypothetical protein